MDFSLYKGIYVIGALVNGGIQKVTGELVGEARLLADELHFTDGEAPAEEFRCQAKIRYGIKVHDCTVTLERNGRAVVKFDEPQRAITTGQSVVFYDDDRLIGGGTIMRAL